MSYLVVITFDKQDEAATVRSALSDMEHGGRIALDDSAVIEKDSNGKIHVKNEMDRGVKIGALGGGFLGLVLASVFFPLAGLALGAAAGALMGAAADLGIERKFVKQVSDSLEPGSSALFVLIRDAEPDAALAVLRRYPGTVYHTSLPAESEENLRRAMGQK